MNTNFNPSPKYTLGVEVEFQTLNRETLNLSPFGPLLAASAPPILRPRLAEEFIQSILEVQTGICFTIDDVEYDLQQTCCLAEELAADNGCVLFAASLHPFALIDDQVLTRDVRYEQIMEELQLVGRQFISQGFHVHVGMPDGDTAIRVLNGIQAYLPLLLAASSSSPFFQGRDTGFMSYRTKLFEMLPLAGIYGHYSSFGDLVDEVNKLVALGVVNSMRDLWWDARINAEFGTIEVRICDLPGRFGDILSLTACIQCLAAFLAESTYAETPLSSHLLQANKWQAARHGLAGKYVDPRGELCTRRIPMEDALRGLLALLAPMSVRLGCNEHLQGIGMILDRDTVASLQRRYYRNHRSFELVIQRLQEEFWT